MKKIIKRKLNNSHFELADNFVFNTIASVEELADHDMIYIYHHLKVGSPLMLTAAGTNVKGHFRYQVCYKKFVLGYVTIGSELQTLYTDIDTLSSEIIAIQKKKFLPISGLDIVLQATKMRMVS